MDAGATGLLPLIVDEGQQNYGVIPSSSASSESVSREAAAKPDEHCSKRPKNEAGEMFEPAEAEDNEGEEDDDELSMVLPTASLLQELELSMVQVEEWFVLQRTQFDVYLNQEPYTAIQALFHPRESIFIHRIWGKTKTIARFADAAELDRLCRSVFADAVACLGVIGRPGKADEEVVPVLMAQFPVERRISRSCLLTYNVSEGALTRLEEEGIGQCSACRADMPDSNDDNDLLLDFIDDSVVLKEEPGDVELQIKEELPDEQTSSASATKRRLKRSLLSPSPALQRVLKKPRSKNNISKAGLPQPITFMREGKKMFRCPECGKVYPHAQSLENHRKRFHMIGSFKCEHCDFGTRFAPLLFVHCTEEHPDVEFKCPSCGDQVFSKYEDTAFEEHYKMCHLSLVRCKKREMYKGRKPRPRVQCEECGGTFANNHMLSMHRNAAHLGIKPFKCPECDFTSPYKPSINVHMKVHMREKGMEVTEQGTPILFRCDKCEKAYTTKGEFNLHVRKVHEGIVERLYCDKCTYSCTAKSALRKHKHTIHESNPALCCEICGKKFGLPCFLNYHMKSHQEPTLFCRHCGKGLKTKQSLAAHERSHTRETPFACDECDYACKASSVLRKHKLAKHNPEQRS